MNKKKIIILSVIAVIFLVSCALIGKIDNAEKNYTESLSKVETEFQKFSETIDEIIAGEDVSFEDFTGQYTQLRIYLSKWNRLYNDLRIWDHNANCEMTSAGEVYMAIDDLYFSVVHTYYIKDIAEDRAVIQDACDDIKGALEVF